MQPHPLIVLQSVRIIIYSKESYRKYNSRNILVPSAVEQKNSSLNHLFGSAMTVPPVKSSEVSTLPGIREMSTSSNAILEPQNKEKISLCL